MKKIILGMACALFMGATAMAEAPEIQYTTDPSQGYTFNRFKDNWFITGEGGLNVLMSKFDQHMDFGDRIGPAASLYVGKWFSPIIGVRVGANYLALRSLSQNATWNNNGKVDGYFKQKFNEFGAVGDVMINLTNWWCGYHPNRCFNSSVYFGGGAYWTTAYLDGKWRNAHNFNTSLRGGWINAVNLSKQVQLSLDLRVSTLDAPQDLKYFASKTCVDLQAYLGLTYNFPTRDWSAPIVPVIPEIPNCDAIEARLQAANAKIADLEAQLRDCLNRPMPAAVECPTMPLTTIYYPIGVSRLSSRDVKVLKAVASVMKENTNTTYTLTGWADNYTGTDAINTRLRHARVNGVARQLARFGVAESQLDVKIDNANLTDLGEKAAPLDRAVTIVANK